jgi:hypothetical protein
LFFVGECLFFLSGGCKGWTVLELGMLTGTGDGCGAYPLGEM